MTAQQVAPRRARTPAAPPKIGPHEARRLVAVESDIVESTCELVYQRDDLAQAGGDENNRLLEAALRVEGLPPLARDLIRRALHIEHGEDAAVRRAERRRMAAHDFNRSASVRVETMLTEREPPSTDDDRGARVLDTVCDLLGVEGEAPLTLAWPLDARQP